MGCRDGICQLREGGGGRTLPRLGWEWVRVSSACSTLTKLGGAMRELSQKLDPLEKNRWDFFLSFFLCCFFLFFKCFFTLLKSVVKDNSGSILALVWD